MKKSTFLIIGILTYFLSYGDTIIEMEEYGGVYRVPCTVNGAKMKFIFDTGASNVCLSLPMTEYLFDNGYLDKSDIKGSGSSSVADGRIVDHITVNLKDIEIGGQHLYNVDAIVIDGQNAPLLLGQSAIQKLGGFKINGNILTLNNSLNSEEYTDEEIDKLIATAMDYYDKELYWKAADVYEDLYLKGYLSDYGKFYFAKNLFYSERFNYAIGVLEEIKDFSDFQDSDNDPFNLMGYCYANIKDYRAAIKNFKEGIALLDLSPKNQSLSNHAISICYGCIDNWDIAKDYAWKAFDNFAQMWNTNRTSLWEHCMGISKIPNLDNDGWLDTLVNDIVTCYDLGKIWSYEKVRETTYQLAKNGFPTSIEKWDRYYK